MLERADKTARGVLLVVALLVGLGCTPSSGQVRPTQQPHAGFYTDGEDVSTLSGVDVERGRRGTFGMGLLENYGSDPIVLVELQVNVTGDLEILGAEIAGQDRAVPMTYVWYKHPVGESDGFGTPEPLVGYELVPDSRTREEARPQDPALFDPSAPPIGEEVLIGYELPPSSSLGGILGYCLVYRVGAGADLYERCLDHSLLVHDPTVIDEETLTRRFESGDLPVEVWTISDSEG